MYRKAIVSTFALVSLMASAKAPLLNSANELLFSDGFNGRTFGKATDVEFVPVGKQSVAFLATPSSTIEYPVGCFDNDSGRIELEVQFTQQLTANHKFWTLISDVGSGGSHPGAINIHWRDNSKKLEFMIYDGQKHHSCISQTTDWKLGKWYRLAFQYGRPGMLLEVDGKKEDANPYTAPLSVTAKKLGYHDEVVEAPPVMVRNFKTYRVHVDSLSVNPPIFTPNGDGLTDECTIGFTVATYSKVTLDILDSKGKVVQQLLKREKMDQGNKVIAWNGRNTSSGAYQIRLTAETGKVIRKLTQPVKVDLRWKWSEVKPMATDFFPIGAWYFWEDDASYIHTHVDDPAVAKAYYESTLKQLGEHGINLIMADWTPHDHRQMMLDAAQRNSVKAILHLDEVNDFVANNKIENGYQLFDVAEKAIRPYKNHPALAAYYIIDEPWNTPDQTERIAFAKKVLEAMDPKHPGLSCLLNAYEETLKRVDYQALVVDIYPIGRDWKGGDLSAFAKEAERGRKNAGTRPLWVILQAFGTRGGWQVPNPTEVEAQVWLSLAAGAKGIMYFMYQSTTSKQGEWIDGWVDMDMKPKGDRLEAIGKINAMVKQLSPDLLKLQPGAFQMPILPDSVYANGFKDAAGGRYIIVANKSTTTAASIPWTGEAVDMLSGEKLSTTVELAPGKGRVLKLVQP
jgi:hypothetical protein